VARAVKRRQFDDADLVCFFAETFEVTIVRDKVDVKDQAATIRYETKKVGKKTYEVGIIELPSFYGSRDGRSSYRDVKELVETARKKKIDGIVLDLSRNGGGLLEDAVRITGLFIQTGAVVATRDSDGDLDVLKDKDDAVDWSGPLLVLISPASASASEILAGALKAYRRAIIAGGAHTFGKGTVQRLNPLPGNLGAIKVTTGMFFVPSGRSTQRIGVSSDIRIPSMLDGYRTSEKDLDYALPAESIAAFRSKKANANNPKERFRPVSSADLQRLSPLSAARIKKDKTLLEVQKELREDKADARDVVRLKEIRAEAKASPELDDDDAKDRFDARQAAFVQEGVNILVDYIRLAQ
ncbi:MAG: S41 family peptidase, partial [Myxococcota bacterium]